jgi:hypothetical protein
MARSFSGRSGIDITNTIGEGSKRLQAEMRKRVLLAVSAGAGLIQHHAASNANVSPHAVGHAKDGRHMRDCIDVEVKELPMVVEAKISIDLLNVPYAVHQEFGPHGNAFMRRAVDETRPEVHGIMQSAIDGTLAEDSPTFVRFRK